MYLINYNLFPFIVPCNGPRLYLHNNMTRIANGREVVAGIPLNCVDGAFYASLCNDGSQVQSGLNYLCQSMGFDSSKYMKLQHYNI